MHEFTDANKAKFKPVARKIQFELIVDQQYTAHQEQKFEAVIDNMNAAKIGFVVYGGDIIGSNRPCDDVTSARRLVTFNRSRLPFILTPGDNDWTDRGRATMGSFDPQERLARLRGAKAVCAFSEQG